MDKKNISWYNNLLNNIKQGISKEDIKNSVKALRKLYPKTKPYSKKDILDMVRRLKPQAKDMIIGVQEGAEYIKEYFKYFKLAKDKYITEAERLKLLSKAVENNCDITIYQKNAEKALKSLNIQSFETHARRMMLALEDETLWKELLNPIMNLLCDVLSSSYIVGSVVETIIFDKEHLLFLIKTEQEELHKKEVKEVIDKFNKERLKEIEIWCDALKLEPDYIEYYDNEEKSKEEFMKLYPTHWSEEYINLMSVDTLAKIISYCKRSKKC